MPIIRRLLIANRGEIAVRIIRTCREMGIQTVAVYSDPDAGGMHTRLADQAIGIGGATPAESYLNGARILAAAQTAACDAVHPGFGFLSENADFAQAVIDAGLVWVGPPPEAIRAMGVKTEALARMKAAGVPTLPGFSQADATLAQYAAAADQIGYPILVKAAAGGGGKGMRVAHSPIDLEAALAAAGREAGKAFADGRLFLEKYIQDAHHIEFQIFADQAGNTIHLLERECSVQRRHQKIIEETPSPYLTADLREKMGQAAVQAAQAVGYVNAGTVEFIVDDKTGAFYFLEMNTRLQVEHPVTEMITGLDLVHWQLLVAMGNPLMLSQADVFGRGHAIECRIYAEDPAQAFLPQTGTILFTALPNGPGVRVDTGVASGDQISIHYDPMIAKLIVHAAHREQAIAKMRVALANYVLLGLTTNIAFLSDLLASAEFISGRTTTRLIDDHFSGWGQEESAPIAPAALIAAALGKFLAGSGQSVAGAPDAAMAAEGDPFNPWVRHDGFRLGG
jgi:3-methylcrotonyl-CoA carboxylase alpha subunit